MSPLKTSIEKLARECAGEALVDSSRKLTVLPSRENWEAFDSHIANAAAKFRGEMENEFADAYQAKIESVFPASDNERNAR